ncbi:hypothetical protein BGZ49_008229 [Haplosporangium sp. Z 27]|nr:hypothetical protein BGZ49_008229 [Haplosporangium sp. Z 27]
MAEQQPPTDEFTPIVLIVGGGLGGLMLAAILETANIPYHVFERATELRPLGSAIALSGNIFPVFEQLGIYEELRAKSLPHLTIDYYNTKLKSLGCLDSKTHKVACGRDVLVIARPRLYEILHRLVPNHKISMGKKVLRTNEENGKVAVFCSDNSVYYCSVLVGADGAYSAVRQSMYKHAEKEGGLPLSDKEELSIGYITMVGIASPPNPEKYSELSDDHSHFRVVIGDGKDSASLSFMTAPNNKICWGLQVQVPEIEAKELHFRNSEWGPESIDCMLEQFEDFPCAFGGTMKEICNATPRNLISKVFLEEKLFKTWYHGRSVLIGDACHKMLPGAGQGAVMAMKDSVVLANCLYSMRDHSAKSVKSAFTSYYRQRYPEAEIMSKGSSFFSKIMFGQKWFDRILRHLFLNYLPDWMLQKEANKNLAYRPQINWLPLAENHGAGDVLPQVGRPEII